MTANRPRWIGRVSRILGLGMLLVGLGSSPALAKTTLRWKFKAGEVLHYSVDQTTVSTGQDPGGREMKLTMGLILDMSWTVKSVDASGVASMVQTIDRVRLSNASPVGKFAFDSKEIGDPASMTVPVFKVLVGAEFSSKMNPRGELTEIKLSDKVLTSLQNENQAAGGQGQFSEDGLKNMLNQMVVPLPEANVDLGETWQRSMAVPFGPEGQTRTFEQIFTYKGHDKAAEALETIDFTTKSELPKPDPNIPIVIKKETATGRFGFDNAAGRIERSNVVENVEMAISIQGKDVIQKVETTRTFTFTKDKSP